MTTPQEDGFLRLKIAGKEKIARDMKKELKKGDKSFRQVEEQCQREVSRSEYDCAMKANGPNEWEACIE